MINPHKNVGIDFDGALLNNATIDLIKNNIVNNSIMFFNFPLEDNYSNGHPLKIDISNVVYLELSAYCSTINQKSVNMIYYPVVRISTAYDEITTISLGYSSRYPGSAPEDNEYLSHTYPTNKFVFKRLIPHNFSYSTYPDTTIEIELSYDKTEFSSNINEITLSSLKKVYQIDAKSLLKEHELGPDGGHIVRAPNLTLTLEPNDLYSSSIFSWISGFMIINREEENYYKELIKNG